MNHHRERFRKLTFQALALHQSEWRRANAWNVSFLNLSQWWFITFINSFDKTKFLFYFHTAIDAILSEIWLPPTRTSPLFSAMKIFNASPCLFRSFCLYVTTTPFPVVFVDFWLNHENSIGSLLCPYVKLYYMHA